MGQEGYKCKGCGEILPESEVAIDSRVENCLSCVFFNPADKIQCKFLFDRYYKDDGRDSIEIDQPEVFLCKGWTSRNES